jgi:hypothetical protein
MTWTADQLAEAMDHIRAIQNSMFLSLLTMEAMSADLAEMRSDVAGMEEAIDRMTARMEAKIPFVSAPSICPI